MRTPYASLIASLLVSALSAQTPVLLKDINPNGNSSAVHITCIGDVAYFYADDGVHGQELWKTDGTANGTVLVKDIVVGATGSFAQDFMELNGTTYFLATFDGVQQLWQTDGTTAGTQFALDFADVDGLLSWDEFAKAGDRIYFTGQTAELGRELWSTDATVAGTQLVADIKPGTGNSGIDYPAEYDGKLYFEASDGVAGGELWVSDGTAAGTMMVKDIYPGVGSGDPMYLTVAGDLLYFRADSPGTGDELWVTDGTEGNTHLVVDLYPGINSSLPSNFTEHNGELYFRGYLNIANDNFIYRSNGTEAGTVALPQPSYDYNLAEGLTSHDGWLYFLAFGDYHKQLWRTDGTAAGTEEFLYPGPTPVQPLSSSYVTVSCNGALIYRANYIEALGNELYTISSTVGLNGPGTVHTGLFPNPTTGPLQIADVPVNGQFQLFATDGRKVLDLPAQRTVDVSSLTDGTYIAHIVTDGRTVRSQVVVLQR